MSEQVKRAAAARDVGSLLLGGMLLGVTAAAWIAVVRADAEMKMAHGAPALSAAGALEFTLQWGVMMAAMMLPSAAPMVLLYRGVRKNAAATSGAAITAEMFALVYVVLWTLTGIPVYVGSVLVAQLAHRSAAFAAATPYLVAATLFAAGVYQFSPAKVACLKACEAPADFLMRRWRGGYWASLRLAAAHAAYCIGCCWALMIVLVAAGAMSLPWVLAIALLVVVEKVLRGGEVAARLIGGGLMVAAAAVAFLAS